MKLKRHRVKPDGETIVTFAVPLFKKDLEEFREYCKIIEADPRTVVYGFIKAVNNGQLEVVPPNDAPFTQ